MKTGKYSSAASFKPCKGCPTPGKCAMAGKCLAKAQILADIFSELSNTNSKPNLMNMLDPANASGWEAEGKRLAVNLPEVTVRDAAKFVAEMTPILGDAIAAKELWDMATSDNPNWPLIGAMGGAAVIGLIPGIGDAAAKGIKAGARKMLDTAKRVEVDPNAMGSMLGNVRLKPISPSSPAQEVSGFRAYHGSPHDFDKFSMEAIGTGEGAQHYGHGLYFAEAEPVAKVYRDQLSNMDTAAAQRVLDKFDGNLNKAILDTYKKFDRLEERFKAGAFEGAEKRYYAQAQLQYNKIMQLEQLAETGKFPTGSMYEVNIAANPENFIDYNAPLNKQTGKVAEYISNYEAMTGRPILDPLPDRDLIGEDLYSSIVDKEIKNTSGDFNYPSYKEGSVLASDYLKREGIPGIKYLDAGSRGTGTANATRNFVVFDENLINIVKKYGVAGAATMLGVAAVDVEQAMAQGAQQPSSLLALQEMQKRANKEQQM